jgi:hypothetical protein
MVGRQMVAPGQQMSGRLDLLLLIWLLFAIAVFGLVVVGMVATRFI